MKELRRLFKKDGSRQLIVVYYDDGKMIMWREATDQDIKIHCGIIARIDEDDIKEVYHQNSKQ